MQQAAPIESTGPVASVVSLRAPAAASHPSRYSSWDSRYPISLSERPTPGLSPALAGAVAQAVVDLTLEDRALRDALRSAIAIRRGYCDWTVDNAGWVVHLLSPDEQEFSGRTLEEALAWCLVWLMAPELGVGPFRA
jgi:hypothetical protein